MLCAIPIVREVVPTDVNKGEEDTAVGGAREALLGDRRPQDMPAQLLKRLAILRRDGDVAV